MALVLIVDDDVFLHKVLNRILSIGGHTVIGHAYNGGEAIDIFNELNPKPDIILMDHRMPIMNGATATRMILHNNPTCFIFFL